MGIRVLRIVSIIVFIVCFQSLHAIGEDKKGIWWKKKRESLYFPHNVHFRILKDRGDPCMRCHPFLPNQVREPGLIREITRIVNEPLKGICHSCHVVDRTASSECTICHLNPEAIRPEGHGKDYTYLHGYDALKDRPRCSDCHVNTGFCTGCHFRRDTARKVLHGIGYRKRHGIDARLSTGRCARCHSNPFCNRCHTGTR